MATQESAPAPAVPGWVDTAPPSMQALHVQTLKLAIAGPGYCFYTEHDSIHAMRRQLAAMGIVIVPNTVLAPLAHPEYVPLPPLWKDGPPRCRVTVTVGWRLAHWPLTEQLGQFPQGVMVPAAGVAIGEVNDPVLYERAAYQSLKLFMINTLGVEPFLPSVLVGTKPAVIEMLNSIGLNWEQMAEAHVFAQKPVPAPDDFEMLNRLWHYINNDPAAAKKWFMAQLKALAEARKAGAHGA